MEAVTMPITSGFTEALSSEKHLRQSSVHSWASPGHADEDCLQAVQSLHLSCAHAEAVRNLSVFNFQA